MTDITIEQAPGFVTITLDRPGAMNALSRALRIALAGAIRAAADNDDIRAIILTGRGERAFSAGIDLKELATPDPRGALKMTPAEDPVEALRACAKPVIAAINGVAITGGLELALACDILIASENARFADTHVRVGILPGWGLSVRLPMAIGPSRAKEMSLTGNFIDARTACDWGLVNRVVAPDALRTEAERIAADIANCDSRAIAGYKAMVDEGLARASREAQERARAADWMAASAPKDMDERRRAVQARGRAQD